MKILKMCTWLAGKTFCPNPSKHVLCRKLALVSSWSQNFDSETDWNIITTPGTGINNRQIKLSRGKFLEGSSGCNGTLCIRGSKQDYDDWGLDGWNGEKFFKYMRRCDFHYLSAMVYTQELT